MNAPARRVIALVRHGEPALSRKVRLTASGYRDWWATYEAGGILAEQSPPDALKAYGAEAGALFVSTRRRAVETARAIVGERSFTPDPLFIEAPLPPPPLPDIMTFSPPYWGVIARTAWWFGYGEGGETRPQAKARASRAAETLSEAAANGPVLLVAHGYFNNMIGNALKQQGYRLTQDQGFKYWAMRRFERD